MGISNQLVAEISVIYPQACNGHDTVRFSLGFPLPYYESWWYTNKKVWLRVEGLNVMSLVALAYD